MDFQYCLNVRFSRPGRRFVGSRRALGAVFGLIAVTPWKIFLDCPPNIKTSPDSRTTLWSLSSLSTSLWSPYKKSAESPMEKEMTGNPFLILSWLSSRSCRKGMSWEKTHQNLQLTRTEIHVDNLNKFSKFNSFLQNPLPASLFSCKSSYKEQIFLLGTQSN